MRTSVRSGVWGLSAVVAICGSLQAAEDDVAKTVNNVIEAAGGDAKLLHLFRFRERVVISSALPAAIKPDEKGNRTSVVEAGGDWWIGTQKRDKDKVRVLAWAWTLRILRAPESKVEALGEHDVAGQPAFGLRVTGSVKEPVDLFFDKNTRRLVAIDYTDTRHVVSEWKKTADEREYASRTIGYRFVNREKRTVSDKPWYHTDILELTPLQELPPDLNR